MPLFGEVGGASMQFGSRSSVGLRPVGIDRRAGARPCR
jgi:hypothetical protein